MLVSALKNALAHPLTKGLALDDPETTELRLQIVRDKPFLREVYDEWYRTLAQRVPSGEGAILELGSGAGYFQQFVPEAIRSEVFFCRNVDLVADACRLPFTDGRLRSVVMTDVFHHIPDAHRFLGEAVRCIHPGGRILMIEPWVSAWSKLIYRNLHHEPFLPEAATWEIAGTGPLSGANGALPWIVFVRDRDRFVRDFPQLHIEEIRPMMPFRYLVSGGISMRNLMPTALHGAWRGLEAALSPWMSSLAMFCFINIRRI
jgi:SAM-dependent methyltransferase